MDILVQDTFKGKAEVIPFNFSEQLIGRSQRCEILLDSPFVSREHARLIYRDKAVLLEALGMNGTFLNSVPLKHGEPVKVEFGDKVAIGEFVLSLQRPHQERRGGYSADVGKKHLELETKIHNELLRKIDLRKISAHDIRSKEYLELVNRNLSLLFNTLDMELDEEVEEYMIKESFKSALLDLVNLGDSSRYRTAVYVDPGNQEAEEQFREFCDRIYKDLADDASPDHGKVQAIDKVEHGFQNCLQSHWLDLSPGLKQYAIQRLLRKDLNDIIFGLGPLEDLMRIPNVTEIMVVSRDLIYIEKKGLIEESGRAFISDEITLSIIERIVSPLGRRIDRSQPLVDARLPDGSRVNAIIPPLALKGPCLTIRKFSKDPFTIDDLIGFGTLTLSAANFLRSCVLAKKNLIVSGGTGTGKTTFLNVLSAFIPSQERIVTVEDSAELQLVQRHVVSLETKPANIEGEGAYSIRDLVRNALRMRPDRIIVGECRGAEALDMLQAMNTGHSGSMTTGHANSAHDILLRLETMVLMAVEMPVTAIRSQIASALDLIVQLNRFPTGERRVTSVTEVVAFDEDKGEVITEDVFFFDGQSLNYTGVLPTFIEELLRKKYLRLEEIF
ncbi:MAG: FHA domain-containing protein [Acidobacteria bacterium]|nr:MAG: FHA domain-containing protein [Acidobacteriota bacterium]